MSISLKLAFQEHFEKHSLSDVRASEMMCFQVRQEEKAKNQFFPDKKRKLASFMVLASCVLLVLASLSMFYKKSIQDKIIMDIIYNHNKYLELEVKSGSFEIIQNYLDKLDFRLVRSSHLPDSEWDFLGGRYGTIDRKLVPLIRVWNEKTGDYYTHYQIPVVKGIPSAFEGYRDGTEVQWWLENGLLLGLVKNTWESPPQHLYNDIPLIHTSKIRSGKSPYS